VGLPFFLTRVDLDPPRQADTSLYEDLAAATETGFIGRRFTILPDDPFFYGFSKGMRPDHADFVRYATLKSPDIRVGIHERNGIVRAYDAFGECVGEYEGPALVVRPDMRRMGIGTLLTTIRAIQSGGDCPQEHCDKIGYSPGGLAAAKSGFACAVAIARRSLSLLASEPQALIPAAFRP
jgi:hypothetical protein